MYNVSADFHNAVLENSPDERVLFRFADGTIFTNEDIHTSGIKIVEGFNLDDELTIGACPSAALDATVMNYHGLLSGFAFGECEVSLGVKTDDDTIAATGANCQVVYQYGAGGAKLVTGHDDAAYLRIDGSAATAQPGFAVKSIVIDGWLVYCFSAAGEVWKSSMGVASWGDASVMKWSEAAEFTWGNIGDVIPVALTPESFNGFMTAKLATWDSRGLWKNGDTEYEFSPDGAVKKYEYAKLGVFRITTPEKRKKDLIKIQAYDRMTLFDVDADSFMAGLTYPTTLGDIYAGLCAFVGVETVTTTFINSVRSFAGPPALFEGVTAKDVLRWIAEAACSIARMNRDGKLELAWFAAQSLSIDTYFKADVAEYEVAAIDKVQVKASDADIGAIIGTGTNGYVIIDNPFMYGTSQAEIEGYATPIYNRLAAFAAFSPLTAAVKCDWSVQAGDIISIEIDGTEYALPVYVQTITWNGTARVSYESTGQASRPVLDAVNRRVYQQNRTIHEWVVDSGQFLSRIEDAEENISTLQQFADEISLSVSNGSTSSTIKLMAGAVELSSQNITFSGFVTFTDLSTSGQTTINGGNITTGTISADRIDASIARLSNLTDGTTTISGGNIKTGTVAAARIDVDNLQVKHLNGADGTFTGDLSGSGGTFHDLTTIDDETGFGMKLFWSSIRFTKNSGSTWSGQFDVDATYGMRIFSSDDVNIYTTGSGKWVNVWGNLKVSTYGGESRIVVASPATASGGSEVRWVDRTGDLGGWSLGRYTSSRKYKENIEYFGGEYGIEVCRQLKPAWFNFKGNDEVGLGMIAEDVAEVCKPVVSYHDGEPDSLQYSTMVTLTISAIQNLDKRIKALEGR